MTASPATTEAHSTFQRGFRDYAIDHIVLHHCASTDMDGVLNMMLTGSREVSANYVVKDDRIASVVPEEYRSWSLSSNLWDGRSITFEICNESVGGSWPVSAASHESVARVVADICTRYGIPCNRDRIIGHREVYSRHGASYATACPGGLDMDWIVARANQILTGATGSAFKGDKVYVFEDAGPGPAVVKTGKFWKVSPGFKRQQIVNDEFGGNRFIRDNIKSVFGADPILRFTPELDQALKQFESMVPNFPTGGGGGGSLPADAATKADVQAIRQDIANAPKPPTTFKAAG